MRTEKELKEIHSKSSYHKDVIMNASKCGCFHCLSTFRSEEIKEWIDKGQTALCPECGIDSVLPNGWANKQILLEMQDKYFLTCVDQYGNIYKLSEMY